jgi:hypothetical protein
LLRDYILGQSQQRRKNGDSTELHPAGGYGAVFDAAHRGPHCKIFQTKRLVFSLSSLEGEVFPQNNWKKKFLPSGPDSNPAYSIFADGTGSTSIA